MFCPFASSDPGSKLVCALPKILDKRVEQIESRSAERRIRSLVLTAKQSEQTARKEPAMRSRSSWIPRFAAFLFALQLVSCRSGGSLQHKCEPTDCNTTLCPPCTDPR